MRSHLYVKMTAGQCVAPFAFYGYLKSEEDKHKGQVQFNIFAQERNDHACYQFDQSGSSSCNGNTCSTQLRCAEKPEDKSGIQDNIQYKSQHIQCHTDRYLSLIHIWKVRIMWQ